MHHDSDSHDSCHYSVFKHRLLLLIVSSEIDSFDSFAPVGLSCTVITKYEIRKDFCCGKIVCVKMVANLIFERAVMLGIFTGSPV